SALQQDLVAVGRLGRKTGRGFHRYTGSPPQPEPAQPRSAAPRAAPRSVRVRGDWGPWAGLWRRVLAEGVDVGDDAGAPAHPGADGLAEVLPVHALLPGGGLLVPIDGRTAADLAAATGRPVTVLDLVLDPTTASRFAVATSTPASDAAGKGIGEAI